MTEYLSGKATTDLEKYRLVTYGTNDGEIKYAAAGDFIAGVTANGAEQNAQCDYTACGLAEVILGGTVTKGDPLTATTDGKAVAASALSVASSISNATLTSTYTAGDSPTVDTTLDSATITNTVTDPKIAGYATVSGVEGDVIRIIIDRR